VLRLTIVRLPFIFDVHFFQHLCVVDDLRQVFYTALVSPTCDILHDVALEEVEVVSKDVLNRLYAFTLIVTAADLCV